MESKRCPHCDLINPALALRCDCGFLFGRSNLSSKSTSSGQGEAQSEIKPRELTLTPCPVCSKKFRLQVPISGRELRCPACGCRLEVYERGGSSLELRVTSDPNGEGIMKLCPFCAEKIQDEAIKCKHCRRWLNKEESPQISSIGTTGFNYIEFYYSTTQTR